MGVIKELCSKVLLLENGEMVDFGDINQVTSKYLSQQQENKCLFEKDLEYVEAFQENDAIVLKASYNTQEFLDIPNLGFTLRDSNGTILFGSNPSIDKVILQFDKNQGEITVKITEPKLLDGDYFFSIWFGNSSANFVSKQDCLMLRIEGMNQNRKHNGNVGPIIPKCEWKIN
jgi:ABC-type multidrug transport system ATPase subunit